MPNITPAVATNFIPTIWANAALDVLKANLVLAKLVMKDSDISAFEVGSALRIPFPGTFTAQDKAADTAVAPQTPAGGGSVTVTLNKHKVVDFIVEDVARAQANQDLLERYVRPAAYALAEAIEKDIWALYASFSQVIGTAGSDITPAVIRQARRTLNDARIPQDTRYLVISPKDEVALLADSSLQTFFAMGRQEAIAKGSLGQLYGFEVYVSQLAPVVTGTPNTTYNLAFHPQAIILAMRGLPEPPASTGIRAATMRDPDTGLVVRVLYSYDVAYRGVRVGLDVLYGVAVLRDAAAVVIRS